MKRCLFALLVSGTLTFVAVACSSSDTTTPVKPGPVSLAISSIAAVGGPTWQPGQGSCLEMGRDPDKTVVVNLDLAGSFDLRPPGTCGSIPNCGTAILRLDPSGDSEKLRVESASSAIGVKFGTIAAGSHTFHVELQRPDGKLVVSQEAGATLYSEVTLDVHDPGGCGTALDAGDAGDAADASDDAATDADAGQDAQSDAADDASDAADDASDAADVGQDAQSDATDAADDADAASD